MIINLDAVEVVSTVDGGEEEWISVELTRIMKDAHNVFSMTSEEVQRNVPDSPYRRALLAKAAEDQRDTAQQLYTR